MINVNDKGVRIEGSMEELIIEWSFITKDYHYCPNCGADMRESEGAE